jgi:hypothetical protein
MEGTQIVCNSRPSVDRCMKTKVKLMEENISLHSEMGILRLNVHPQSDEGSLRWMVKINIYNPED